jgi:hypothetical protein
LCHFLFGFLSKFHALCGGYAGVLHVFGYVVADSCLVDEDFVDFLPSVVYGFDVADNASVWCI